MPGTGRRASPIVVRRLSRRLALSGRRFVALQRRRNGFGRVQEVPLRHGSGRAAVRGASNLD